MESVECHPHALLCSITVVFIHTMEDDQRLNTSVHEGDTLHFPQGGLTHHENTFHDVSMGQLRVRRTILMICKLT